MKKVILIGIVTAIVAVLAFVSYTLFLKDSAIKGTVNDFTTGLMTMDIQKLKSTSGMTEKDYKASNPTELNIIKTLVSKTKINIINVVQKGDIATVSLKATVIDGSLAVVGMQKEDGTDDYKLLVKLKANIVKCPTKEIPITLTLKKEMRGWIIQKEADYVKALTGDFFSEFFKEVNNLR